MEVIGRRVNSGGKQEWLVRVSKANSEVNVSGKEYKTKRLGEKRKK